MIVRHRFLILSPKCGCIVTVIPPIIYDNVLDAGVQCEGFPIRAQMPEAGIVKFDSSSREQQVRAAIGRNDRPGYPSKPQKNQLIFSFKLADSVLSATANKLVLRGPEGFKIADECTSKVIRRRLLSKILDMSRKPPLRLFCSWRSLTW